MAGHKTPARPAEVMAGAQPSTTGRPWNGGRRGGRAARTGGGGRCGAAPRGRAASSKKRKHPRCGAKAVQASADPDTCRHAAIRGKTATAAHVRPVATPARPARDSGRSPRRAAHGGPRHEAAGRLGSCTCKHVWARTGPTSNCDPRRNRWGGRRQTGSGIVPRRPQGQKTIIVFLQGDTAARGAARGAGGRGAEGCSGEGAAGAPLGKQAAVAAPGGFCRLLRPQKSRRGAWPAAAVGEKSRGRRQTAQPVAARRFCVSCGAGARLPQPPRRAAAARRRTHARTLAPASRAAAPAPRRAAPPPPAVPWRHARGTGASRPRVQDAAPHAQNMYKLFDAAQAITSASGCHARCSSLAS
jgi:hypothetical protein